MVVAPDCVFIEGATRGQPRGKGLRIEARQAFAELIGKLGLQPPKVVMCGGRSQAYKDFKREHAKQNPAQYVALLVDSEDPVQNLQQAWAHLAQRDRWRQPAGAAEEQVLLMVTCMEAWIAADRATLEEQFGAGFRSGGLVAPQNVESTNRAVLLKQLEVASKDCRSPYGKGARSFELLAALNPAVPRQHCASFHDFEAKLRAKLAPRAH